MSTDDFNRDEAKKFLEAREAEEKQERETDRKEALRKVISILKEEFAGSSVEAYLVGSLIRPFQFSLTSDVDIVLKNFQGDRFDLWPKLEKKIGRKVEIILFETCHFQEFVVKEGLKVV